ncbi:MAG: hypothetical protein ACRDHP_07415 [Ktedonobacterales bacterium]
MRYARHNLHPHPLQRIHVVLLGGTAALVALVALALGGCGALVTPPPNLHAAGSTAVTHPYATPAATQPLYSNPLTSAVPGWANVPECVFTANGLSVRPSGGQAYICLAPVTAPDNVSITVTVQQESGPPTHSYGIAFRHAAPKSYYFFGIDSHGRFMLSVVVNDVSHTVIPFTASAAIHSGPGASNQLQVVAQGQTATLLVNGAPVGQATLSTFSSGAVGLRGIDSGNVVFSQLTIAQV